MKKINPKTLYDPVDCAPEVFLEPSKTSQEFAQECNLRAVIQNYEATGQFYNALDPKHMRPREQVFIDARGIENLEQVGEVMSRARDTFLKLPARFRAVFENSPEVFSAVLNTPGALKSLIDRGLIPQDYILTSSDEVNTAKARKPLKVRIAEAEAHLEELRKSANSITEQ